MALRRKYFTLLILLCGVYARNATLHGVAPMRGAPHILRAWRATADMEAMCGAYTKDATLLFIYIVCLELIEHYVRSAGWSLCT
jgi:hypothetical protein